MSWLSENLAFGMIAMIAQIPFLPGDGGWYWRRWRGQRYLFWNKSRCFLRSLTCEWGFCHSVTGSLPVELDVCS
jgi:hypothetical protein